MQLLFPAHPLARRSGVRSRMSDERAFTLIELLTVITIIGILMAISLGVFSGVKERAAVAQARSELASLSVSLESYKRQYGDYPYAAQFPVAGSAVVTGVIAAGTAQYDFFNAMAGLYGPWNYVTSTRAKLTNGRAFVDLVKFTLEQPGVYPDPANAQPAANSFLDPWGRRYLYYYIPPVITSGVLTTPSKYVLCSVGPGSNLTSSQMQDSSPPDKVTGIVDYTAAANAKHIYANR